MLENDKIGMNISRLRRGLQLTQVEISTLLGVSHQAVSKWENGGCLPDIEMLLRLGKIFNQSVEELLLSERVADHVFPGGKVEHVYESSDRSRVWAKVLDEIRKKISSPSFNAWLRNTNAEYVEETFLIYSPNSSTSEWLYHRYSPLILKTLKEITGESDFKLEFRSRDTNDGGNGFFEVEPLKT
ncbi:helix-turn-helix transcriptional regulator [Paenibacillus luteus]|uniref:helix-turn-helix transcriptional regulator n=1 Tax=Paenibacillus luteus TaxID=2545753 RepID=UPI0011432B38|nr:helix-turn-helix transcriptional regulator [Paenibacillus luteus]